MMKATPAKQERVGRYPFVQEHEAKAKHTNTKKSSIKYQQLTSTAKIQQNHHRHKTKPCFSVFKYFRLRKPTKKPAVFGGNFKKPTTKPTTFLVEFLHQRAVLGFRFGNTAFSLHPRWVRAAGGSIEEAQQDSDTLEARLFGGRMVGFYGFWVGFYRFLWALYNGFLMGSISWFS